MSTNSLHAATIFCWLVGSAMVLPATAQKLKPTTPPVAQTSEFDRLQQEELIEQIKKLKLESQALSQALSQPPPPPADQSIPIWAACIAAFVALLVPQITSANQAGADRRKEMRLALAQFGGNCAAAIHHIQWLTWKPAHDLGLTTADFDAYDNAMNLLFPQLIGSFLTASALNPSLFAQMKKVHDEIVDTDSTIGQLVAKARSTNNEDRVKLTEFHKVVNKLWDALLVEFQAFMK